VVSISADEIDDDERECTCIWRKPKQGLWPIPWSTAGRLIAASPNEFAGSEAPYVAGLR
jgi:hypothetical protein